MTTPLPLRARVAVGVVRVVNWLSRVTGRGAGTVVGGRAGLVIFPDLLACLAEGRTVVVVSGTNGKTTTTALTAAGWGGEVTTNRTGSNMPEGHVAALVESRSPRVVLEADEAWLPEVVRQTRPRVVVLLNLSRDQLDRANEVRQMSERWRACFYEHRHERLTVVANANDPLVAYAARGTSRVLWCDVPTPWLEDAKSCPQCAQPLEHRGSFWYSTCGFSRPASITTTLGDRLTVAGASRPIELSLPGEFNEVNAAMALTALHVLGEDLDASLGRVNAVTGVAGRFDVRRWGDHRLRLLLAKNPAGFAAILSTVAPEPKDVWIAINARVADGRDPSWLYDVGFEQLRGHRVWCLGDRRLDLATRLDYAGVECRVVDDPGEIEVADGPVSLMANYTAFSEWLSRSSPC